MAKTKIVKYAVAFILGIILTSAVYHFFLPKPEPKVIYQGIASMDYDWFASEEDSLVQEFETSMAFQGEYQIYPIKIKHENFQIEGKINTMGLKSIEITHISFHGEADITMTEAGIISKPRAPGLILRFDPAKLRGESKFRAHFDVLVASQVFPPYHVFIAAGAGINRLPLIGKLPDITIGPCVIVDQLGVFIAKRW
jgi:hypothetical protein